MTLSNYVYPAPGLWSLVLGSLGPLPPPLRLVADSLCSFHLLFSRATATSGSNPEDVPLAVATEYRRTYASMGVNTVGNISHTCVRVGGTNRSVQLETVA